MKHIPSVIFFENATSPYHAEHDKRRLGGRDHRTTKEYTMTIKDIETQTGLARANIRYYESEGLIAPERAENGNTEVFRIQGQVFKGKIVV